MTIQSLLEYANACPARWDARLYVITETPVGFQQACIRNVQIDSDDRDLNFVVDRLGVETITLGDIRDVLERGELEKYPLFSRRILEDPIVVDGDSYTHIDTFLYGISDGGSGAVGLFEKNT